jgi:hypothetical protein
MKPNFSTSFSGRSFFCAIAGNAIVVAQASAVAWARKRRRLDRELADVIEDLLLKDEAAKQRTAADRQSAATTGCALNDRTPLP